jgi:MFS family permease
MRDLLRLPQVRIVFCALAVSMIGDSMMLTIPAVLVRQGSNSNAAAGFEIFFFTAPICIAPMSGSLVDRFRRRNFLICVNIISASLVVPLLAVTTPGYWWTGYLVATFLGCSYVCINAGVSGLIPQIVPDGLLGNANSFLSSFRQGLRLIGPVSGLLVYEKFGIGAITGVDAASFIVAATVFATLNINERAIKPRPNRGPSDFSAGFIHLFKTGSLHTAATILIPFSIACGVTGSATYAIVTDGLNKPPEFVGFMISMMGIGAIFGGLIAARMIERLGEISTIMIGVASYGVGSIGLAIPSVPLALTGMLIAGVGVTLPIIGRMTLMQRNTPSEMLGQVSFAWDSFGTTIQLISMGLCASLLAFVNFRYILIPAALITSVSCIAGLKPDDSRRVQPALTIEHESVSERPSI